MARLRPIKKWGNSLVVVFNTLDVKDLGIKEGDDIDIDAAIVKKK